MRRVDSARGVLGETLYYLDGARITVAVVDYEATIVLAWDDRDPAVQLMDAPKWQAAD
jgi:hypothetical protein